MASKKYTFAQEISIQVVKTSPYDGQKPGTSGLRKKTTEAQQPHYIENFVQSIFSAIWTSDDLSTPNLLVVGGDGRYYNDIACKKILKIACAHNIDRVVIGQGGLLSTPALSAMVRDFNTKSQNCLGGNKNLFPLFKHKKESF